MFSNHSYDGKDSMHFISKTTNLKRKYKITKIKLNPLFLKLKGLLKHTLVSHVHSTLLNTAVIIVIRACWSILQLKAEPPLLRFHVGNHIRFDYSQQRKREEI